MNTNVTRLESNSSNTEKQAHGHAIKFVAAFAVFIMLMLGVAIWMQPAADIEAISSAQSAPRSIDKSSNTEYFPAQYQNQGAEIPEHIQAF